ncbi:MAG: twin-arginine translocation signal domain-containing protein [Pyrinomonadaceae bacterium]|nr:twin-arginine translocation signal domain-containing protein [Pyrinomonadaceae bacterium]
MKDSKLNRRNFLKASAVGVTALTTANNFFGEELTALPSESGRQIIELNHGWLYNEKFTPEATKPNFNDKSFTVVNIPHTNKMMPLNGFDEQDYCFVSVYRKKFILPKGIENKRVFIDFGGVMTAAKVYLNGQIVGENKGGYNDFSFELTKFLNWKGENLLAVEVDSTERKDIPPFGNLIDYLTFGGIYRDVQLRIVNPTFIENVFVTTVDVLTENPKLQLKIFYGGKYQLEGNNKIKIELLDAEKVIVNATDFAQFPDDGPRNPVYKIINVNSPITLWDINNPKLYKIRIRLVEESLSYPITEVKVHDQYETKIGFREAKFTPEGFFLNGKHLKLRGLNRHQTYPWVGQAMPARVQKRDAWILKHELKTNIVRTSHYMNSPHFLDACDEYGLLVLEEIPGWQHIGDKAWQDLSVRDVEAMIKRDWNHPSIILWGVRINESGDNHDFYTRTNATAKSLDDSRQIGGIRNKYDSELLEDVFTMNDFRFPLRPPNHPLYLNTEHNGHMYPTKRFDNVERVREHTHRHARYHDMLASDAKYAGGLAWCAFDYNTHSYFGSGDRICYHGVSDIFRIPKPAAGFYKSQCDPSEEIVIEPAFDWATGDEGDFFKDALICSNCEKLKVYLSDELQGEIEPDRKTYLNLKYPPFVINLKKRLIDKWGVLKIEGYIGGKLVGTRQMSGKGVEAKFLVNADDKELIADAIDMTRVVFRVTDEFENTLPFAFGAIQFSIENGEIVGDNPASLIGGSGAIWVKSTQKAGLLRLTAKHPRHGSKVVEIKTTKSL